MHWLLTLYTIDVVTIRNVPINSGCNQKGPRALLDAGYGDVTKVASSMNENSAQREKKGGMHDVRVMIDSGATIGTTWEEQKAIAWVLIS